MRIEEFFFRLADGAGAIGNELKRCGNDIADFDMSIVDRFTNTVSDYDGDLADLVNESPLANKKVVDTLIDELAEMNEDIDPTFLKLQLAVMGRQIGVDW